jgi:CRP/FNR family transcriptional regulator, cyclic AMP receptor protein
VTVVEPSRAEGRPWCEAPAPRPQARVASLSALDPDLGCSVPSERAAWARRDVAVRVAVLRRGPWPVQRPTAFDPGDLGLLIVDGLVGREVVADDVTTMELLGAGDIVVPWQEPADFPLLRAVVRWSVLADARVALLDRAVAGRLVAHPEIVAALMERCSSRARRLAVMQAIAQMNRVDRRLLTLLWHLAERWGRVTVAGVHVPLRLSHRMLAQLVGARRPTVSTALGELTHAGEISRRPDGTWLLTGEPVGTPDERSTRFVAPRRHMLAVEPRHDPRRPQSTHMLGDDAPPLRPAHHHGAGRPTSTRLGVTLDEASRR